MWLQIWAQRKNTSELIRRKSKICDIFTRVKLVPNILLFLTELWCYLVWCTPFLFKRVRKIAKSRLLASSCLPVRTSEWNNYTPTGRIFMKSDIRLIFSWKSEGKIQVSLKSDKNNGYSTWRPMWIYYTTRVGTLIMATIYLQLIQNRYMFRSFAVLQCSHQHCVQPVASDVEVVGYL